MSTPADTTYSTTNNMETQNNDPSEIETMFGLWVEQVLKDDANKVVDSLKRLWDILLQETVMDETEAKDSLTLLGVHRTLLAVMSKWKHDANIQHFACRCLAVLLVENEVAMTDLALSGGMESICAALERFPESENVQAAGIWAMQNLLCGGNATTQPHHHAIDEATKRFVVEVDGLALVVKAMEEFPANAFILGCSSWLFHNLYDAHDEYYMYCQGFVQQGVAEAVQTALQNHAHDDGVKEAATVCLEKIFATNKKQV
ncbi:expressed unknown protein [Seminavis robusta]|uniref:LRRK2 ARM repeat domain-containing protein n=1 Tax=Seminavis robusta TaxID=568900 RepID=A0A9N8DBL5_9STRA|nr:expressed unknown protein [Seminavis robusta]|eukprot:Sro9_g007100.1 n/a (259) ;mRNA; r:49903-50679